MNMESEEIIDSVNEISNSDAEQIIKQVKKESKRDPDRVFAEKLQKYFPDLNISHPNRVKNECDKYLHHYKQALNSAKVKAQRSIDYENMYTLGKKTVSCNSCDTTFKTKAMATKHIQKEHLNLQIEEIALQDTTLLEFKVAKFYWPNITEPKPIVEEIPQEQEIDLQERIEYLEAENLAEKMRTKEGAKQIDKLERQVEKLKSNVNELQNCDRLIIGRQSSVVGSEAFHATEIKKNNNVKGGFSKLPTIVQKIPYRKGGRKTENTLTNKQIKRNAKQVNMFTAELSRHTTPKVKSKILNKVLEENKENIEDIVSPSLIATNQLTPNQSADVLIDTNMSRAQQRKVQQAAITNTGKRLFAPERQVLAAKKLKLNNITADHYTAKMMLLHCRSQGKKTSVLKPSPVVYPTQLKSLIKQVIENEAAEHDFEIDPESQAKKVHIGLTGDSGGGSMKWLFGIMNDHKESKLTTHTLFMYEAADTINNDMKVMSEGGLYDELKELNNLIIKVNGERYLLEFGGVFDLKAQDEFLGKQGSTSKFPCAKCHVPLSHLQKHGGTPHDIETCSEFLKERTFSEYDKAYEKNVKEAGATKDVTLACDDNSGSSSDDIESDDDIPTVQLLRDRRKNGKNCQNIISQRLLPFNSLCDIADPLLHINIGLVNDNLREMRKLCREFDSVNDAEQLKTKETMILKFLEKMNKLQEEEKQCFKYMTNIQEICLRRIELILKGREIAAEKQAFKFYNFNKPKPFVDRKTCDSVHCLLFPIDEDEGNDMKIKCNECDKIFHLYCEGLCAMSKQVKASNFNYKCNKCNNMTDDEHVEKFHQEIVTLKSHQEKLSFKINNLEMSLKHLKYESSNLKGKCEKLFEDSLKQLKTVEASYHGGALNGNDITKILKSAIECESFEDFVMVKCFIERDASVAEKFYTLFTILGNTWVRLRAPTDDPEKVNDAIKYCQEWGRKLPILFPERTITRKGHVLSIHVPEYLHQKRVFNQYYKLEQRGESVHAAVNKLMRRLFPLRPKSYRLLKIVLGLEQQNNVNPETFKKNK